MSVHRVKMLGLIAGKNEHFQQEHLLGKNIQRGGGGRRQKRRKRKIDNSKQVSTANKIYSL